MKHRPFDALPVRLSRRQVLRACGAGLMGLSLPSYFGLRSEGAAKPAGHGFGRAKSCIVLYCWGGISHIDTWDPKPNAPAEIRGEFTPIATSVPGIQIGEHMPLLARQMHRLAIVRSIHHNSAAHGKGMYWNMTGHAPPQAEVHRTDAQDYKEYVEHQETLLRGLIEKLKRAG